MKGSYETINLTIGVCDNVQEQSERHQRVNAIGEIQRCVNRESNLMKIKNQGNLELKVRGSISKRDDNTKNCDSDLHIIFENTYDLSDCKE